MSFLVRLGPAAIAMAAFLFPATCVASFEPGTIVTIAGGGVGDGLPARYAFLDHPSDLCFDGEGNLYIADTGNGRVRRVGKDGVITTVAGGGSEAILRSPTRVVVDPYGNLYVKDRDSHYIWKMTPDGTIHSLAFKYVDEGHELSLIHI